LRSAFPTSVFVTAETWHSDGTQASHIGGPCRFPMPEDDIPAMHRAKYGPRGTALGPGRVKQTTGVRLDFLAPVRRSEPGLGGRRR
jgi:hypothetical protein